MTADHEDVVEALNKINISLDPVYLSKAYGYRFTRAWEAVKEGRVKKYVFQPSGRVYWIVVGKEKEYLIYPEVGYCQCEDFYFAVIDGDATLCYHLIAWRLAQALGHFDLVMEDDRLYRSLFEEWRKV